VSFHLSLSTEPVTAAYPDDPLLVSPDASVGEVLRLLKAHLAACVLVCADHRLLGIFTERDALAWIGSGQIADLPVESLMSRTITSVNEKSTVGEAIRLMSQGGYRRLPIVSADGEPTGVIGVHGLVRYLVEHFPQTIYTLPPKPDSVQAEREGA
jgi:CBS domain-containing protein